jgi:hypothetical protein
MENKLIEQACLQLAKQLIEIKFCIDIEEIKFEDGSGSNYIFTAKGSDHVFTIKGEDPKNWIFIKLL